MSEIKAWLENLSDRMGHDGEINEEVMTRGEEIMSSGGGFDLEDEHEA